jgi:hypothetical protein
MVVAAVSRNCTAVGVMFMAALPMGSAKHAVVAWLKSWPRIPDAAWGPWVGEIQQKASKPAWVF